MFRIYYLFSIALAQCIVQYYDSSVNLYVTMLYLKLPLLFSIISILDLQVTDTT